MLKRFASLISRISSIRPSSASLRDAGFLGAELNELGAMLNIEVRNGLSVHERDDLLRPRGC